MKQNRRPGSREQLSSDRTLEANGLPQVVVTFFATQEYPALTLTIIELWQ
jgi:hypothetical protein